MRTIIEQKTVYLFEELPEESQKMAIENYQDFNIDYAWYEYTIDFWKEKLESIGFDNAEINFSGFWSQGDGACFTSDIDFLNLLPTYIDYALTPGSKQARRLIALAETGYFDGLWKIEKQSYHYSHENTVHVSGNTYYLTCLSDSEVEDIEQNIIEIARHYMQKIYSDLESEYNYLTSDEAIKESLIANEYEFSLDGKIY